MRDPDATDLDFPPTSYAAGAAPSRRPPRRIRATPPTWHDGEYLPRYDVGELEIAASSSAPPRKRLLPPCPPPQPARAVLMTESGAYRIVRVEVQGPVRWKVTPLLENLAGFLVNISRDAKGRF